LDSVLGCCRSGTPADPFRVRPSNPLIGRFGAGPFTKRGRECFSSLGEGAIERLALVAIHDDRTIHIIAAGDGLAFAPRAAKPAMIDRSRCASL